MKVFGTKYSKGSAILTGLHYGDPVLGEVVNLFIVNTSAVVTCFKQIQVVDYVTHLNAYRVVSSYEIGYIVQDKMIDFHPLGIHRGFGDNSRNLYVVLRHRVDCKQE